MESTPELHIQMLGGFSISYGDHTIEDLHSRSGKLWSFLEFLVAFHAREISQNEIIDLLWPEEDGISDPGNTLKTLLHRVRTLLGQLDKDAVPKSLVYRRGSYRWAPTIPCHMDTEDFESLSKEAYSAVDESLRLEKFLQAIALYKGDFLPRSALDPWVMPIHTYYRTQYIKIVYDTIDLLDSRGQFDQILAICQKAVTIDPYAEGLHMKMIQALLATGAQRQALEHYKHVTDLFFTQFGVSPSEELTALYKEVVKTEKSTELDLHIIKEALQECNPQQKAFHCEYEFFKDVYRLEARSALRTGQIIHIALITITSDNHAKTLSQKQINTVMEQLKEVIGCSLRRNDVYSRYSVTQYLLMLPSASFENSQMVLNRIISAYRRQHPKAPVTLQYRVLPLDPVAMGTPQ